MILLTIGIISNMILFGDPVPAQHPKDVPYTIEFTQEDIELLNRLCMSEAGREPFDGKQAVVQTAINRIKSPLFPDNLKDVLDGQYSLKDNGEPNQECNDAVLWTISHQNAFPNDMFWFQKEDYFEEVEGKRYDYTKIGKHYFSTERNYND